MCHSFLYHLKSNKILCVYMNPATLIYLRRSTAEEIEKMRNADGSLELTREHQRKGIWDIYDKRRRI